MSNHTGLSAWRRLRDRVVLEEPVCQIALPGICTGISTTADHILTVKDRPDLTLTRANLRGACDPCNRRRSSLPDHLIARPGHQPLNLFA